MKILRWLIVTLCCLSPAGAYWQSRLQIGIGSAAVYSGPGDIVSGATAWWGLRAYNAAYATGLNKLANVCTPLDVTCADVNSDANGNFDIGSVGALTCNNGASICTVKILYDQSGNTNDLTQATIANRATLIVAGASNGCPSDGFPCMAFTTSQGYSRTPGTQAQPYSMIAVAIRTSAFTSFGSILSFNNGFIGLYFNSDANQFAFFATSILIKTASDSVWHSLLGIGNGASGKVAVDGSITTGNAGNSSITATTSTLGDDTIGDPLMGKMTESGYWPLAITTQNITDLNTNIHSYWNF